MTDELASADSTRRDGYPSTADLDVARIIITQRGGLTLPTGTTLFGPRASREWKQWLLDHWRLPALRVRCGRCNYILGWWRLDYGQAVAMPYDRTWREDESEAVRYTDKLAASKGTISDAQTHDGRGDITYTCRGRNCTSTYKAASIERTLQFINALRNNDEKVVLKA